MRSAVFMFSCLCLSLAAPVEEHHEREARDASEEEDLRVLLTEMKETLATINNNNAPVPEVPPQLPQDPQASLQPRPAIILAPLPPAAPQLEPKPAQGPATPQINLFISTNPQQGGAGAPQPRPRPAFPGQEVLIGGAPVPPMPFLPPAGAALPLPNLAPQDVPMMATLPERDPQNPPQNQFIYPTGQYPFINPYLNPYGNPYGSLYGNLYGNPYGNLYGNPYLQGPYGINRGFRPPPIAITPPIIFRERTAGATIPV
ncbi:formin-like protein 3 [Astyanax mexicanus]|uniref:Formin-like protein 3 n=1 Tax=Astyanax mexicanus TaxID=7994 RepID=A0A8T2KQJ1_ASTMX|nr:formin-like protein 3 [Astyanax mexicanus]